MHKDIKNSVINHTEYIFIFHNNFVHKGGFILLRYHVKRLNFNINMFVGTHSLLILYQSMLK